MGETYTKACQSLEAIKHELVSNDAIHQLFGRQRGPTWAENKIILKNGVIIEAHGWEEESRGFKHHQYRPDRIHIDDVENKERVQQPDVAWKKIHKEYMPALDRRLGKLRITGTPLADDCLITRCKKSPAWVYAEFPIDTNEIPIWPERYPREWIQSKLILYTMEGLLAEFNQEYRLIPTGAQDKPFLPDMIQHAADPPRGYHPKTVIMDPARTTDIKKSDQTGYVVVSQVGSKIYVHKSGAEYWQPDAVIDGAFSMSEQYDDADVAIEEDSLDEWLRQPLRMRMLKTGSTLKLKSIRAPNDRSKTQFIMGLQPFFKGGDIILIGDHPVLEAQLVNFPSGKRDCLNALAYIQKVFAGEVVYGDFSDANISRNRQAQRNSVLILACNATATETTTCLCSLDGEHITVLADWISPLPAVEAMHAVVMYTRAVHRGVTITAWCPADVVDQQGRNPLVSALKTYGWTAQRGEYSSAVRGCLSNMLRTEVRGHRLLKVDINAHNTLHALASGYRYNIKGGEPERNSARTLIEGLEILAFALTKMQDTDTLVANTTNASGVPYFSSLQR